MTEDEAITEIKDLEELVERRRREGVSEREISDIERGAAALRLGVSPARLREEGLIPGMDERALLAEIEDAETRLDMQREFGAAASVIRKDMERRDFLRRKLAKARGQKPADPVNEVSELRNLLKQLRDTGYKCEGWGVKDLDAFEKLDAFLATDPRAGS